MRFLIIVAAALSVSASAHARPYRIQNKINSVKLLGELGHAGIMVNSLDCPGSFQGCVLYLPDREKRNPEPVIQAHQYEDWAAQDAEQRKRLEQLAQKWKGGELTPQEKDKLLRLLVFQVLGMR